MLKSLNLLEGEGSCPQTCIYIQDIPIKKLTQASKEWSETISFSEPKKIEMINIEFLEYIQ